MPDLDKMREATSLLREAERRLGVVRRSIQPRGYLDDLIGELVAIIHDDLDEALRDLDKIQTQIQKIEDHRRSGKDVVLEAAKRRGSVSEIARQESEE